MRMIEVLVLRLCLSSEEFGVSTKYRRADLEGAPQMGG